MPGATFLRGDGVELRTVEEEDVAFLARWRTDPRVRRWMPRAHPQTRAEAGAELEEEEEDALRLLACDGDERLGVVSLFFVVPESGRAMLGAWLKPDAQGEGYGTEATELVVEYAFAERRLEKLEAGALATNEPSRALLESVGFRQEGIQRSHYFVEGERIDRAAYGLTREQWAE
jgi:RimJ/RimL family protein N-acetyltransferase